MRDDIIRMIRSESNDGDANGKPSVQDHVIPQGVEYPKPDSVFELSGIPVFTKKSISTLIGKAKSGKTTATAWLVAQCIRGGLTVVWADTEQGEYYGSRTQHWILTIAGMPFCDGLKYLDLKTLKPQERTDIIESAIAEFTPDLIVIDGIRDLVYDINDPQEATIVSGHCMRWAEQHDLHVLSILHQNKGNEYARGHLGAEMVNKSETVLSVSTDDSMNVVCEPEFTRSEPFQPFAFARDGYGLPVLIDGYVGRVEVSTGSRSVKPTDYTIEEHKYYISYAFQGSDKMNYGEFQSALSAAFGAHGIEIGVVKTKAFIAHYSQNKLVKKDRDGMRVFYTINYELTENQ